MTFSEDKDYLAEYLELYRQNEDMVGWIKVEDTNINYPVVQSVNEPNFYLKHKFDNSSRGTVELVNSLLDDKFGYFILWKYRNKLLCFSIDLDVYKRQAENILINL